VRGNIINVVDYGLKLKKRRVAIIASKWFFKRDGTDRTDLRIEKMLEQVAVNANLAHSARFALTSLLLYIDMSVDQVVGLFNNSPDFDQEKIRYQVEHIAGSSGTKKTAILCDHGHLWKLPWRG
jgi:hypothetical protein